MYSNNKLNSENPAKQQDYYDSKGVSYSWIAKDPFANNYWLTYLTCNFTPKLPNNRIIKSPMKKILAQKYTSKSYKTYEHKYPFNSQRTDEQERNV